MIPSVCLQCVACCISLIGSNKAVIMTLDRSLPEYPSVDAANDSRSSSVKPKLQDEMWILSMAKRVALQVTDIIKQVSKTKCVEYFYFWSSGLFLSTVKSDRPRIHAPTFTPPTHTHPHTNHYLYMYMWSRIKIILYSSKNLYCQIKHSFGVSLM